MCALWSLAFLAFEARAANWLALLLVCEIVTVPETSLALDELLALSESVETVVNGE
jgi:hypothetical protein